MSITSNLELNKHDNPSSNTNPFDIENYLNANWNKIDQFAGNINSEITDINDDINDINTGKADKNELPTKVSDLTNDTGFITNAVNNLVNYYLKSDTYTKTEVNTLISNITKVTIQVVAELPQVGESNVIYLVPSSNPKTKNIKDEYIYVNNNWEQIGSTEIDLTGYATENWVNAQISDFLTEAQIETLVANALADYYDKDEVDELLTELQQENKTLRKAGYKLNGTGENVTLNKTSDNRFVKLDVKGNKKQDSYEGYQLFDKDNITVINGYVLGNSTAIGDNGATNKIAYMEIDSNATYTIEQFYGSLNNFNVATTVDTPAKDVAITDKQIGTSTGSVTITSGASDKYLVIYAKVDNITIANLLDYIQVTKGSTAKGIYEPYIGGQPAPNPNYECPVKAVGDDGVVNTEIVNKNLANKSTFIHGYYDFENKILKEDTTSWNRISKYIKIKPNTAYTFSINTSIHDITIIEFDENKKLVGLFIYGLLSKTFTTQSNSKYVVISLGYGATFTDELFEPYEFQLEPNTVATTYTPHQEQVYNIPCQKPMLDESDYFDWDNEQEVHGWNKVVLDGTENYALQSINEHNIANYRLIVGNNTMQANTIISNNFIHQNASISQVQTSGIFNNVNEIYIRIDSTIASTVEQFKSYLAEQYANETPVYVWYKLAEPELLPFTAEQKAVAKEIDKATSYYEQTNIFSINEVSPIYDTTAVADMNLVIDELSQAIVANGGV